jgi:hypothetical protein
VSGAVYQPIEDRQPFTVPSVTAAVATPRPQPIAAADPTSAAALGAATPVTATGVAAEAAE